MKPNTASKRKPPFELYIWDPRPENLRCVKDVILKTWL